jgi:hypothetical protein
VVAGVDEQAGEAAHRLAPTDADAEHQQGPAVLGTNTETPNTNTATSTEYEINWNGFSASDVK